ncbi:MAG TPA: DUF1801 domain-containing protein [Gemmatimonadales bacterium]|nr:DUF1801 domain-containing protein [Gemmatimonadales bacterium]
MADRKSAKKATKAPKHVQEHQTPLADQTGGEAALLAKVAEMPAPYRAIAERLHELIMRSAPCLTPRVRYGMPWYMKDGQSWCFFRAARSFVTFGFDDPADLTRSDGTPHPLVPSAYRITALDDATEAQLSAIVRHVAS